LTALELWPMLRHMPDGDSPARKVQLFRNGRNQAVRIPRELELAGTEATIRREGDKLIIEPIEKPLGLIELLRSWDPIDEDFEIPDDPPPEPVDL
jgi:antitoxin VapB